MAAVIWQGALAQGIYRVIDRGVGLTPRLLVEQQLQPDAMGGTGWQSYEPIPRAVFEGLLLAAHVVT